MARSFTVKARTNRSLSPEQKLNNFPPIHFIGIDNRLDRVSGFISMLKDFKISKVIPHIFKKYRHGDHDIRFFSPHYDRGYPQGHFGCFTSHLKVLYEWYNNTDEPYIFVCEDDLSFETIEYWNFTWEEFFERLPENWDIVQLCLLRNIGTMFNFFQPDVHFRNRCWCDWSSAAYLISRKHVKNLLDTYMSMLYGVTHSLDISEIATFLSQGVNGNIVLVFAVAFIAVRFVAGVALEAV